MRDPTRRAERHLNLPAPNRERLFKNSLLPDEVWQGINMDQESGISRHLVQLIETEQTIFAAHPGIFQIHGSREKQILS
ncbi:hypothetical protein Y1Q_0023232 [Alligator mississippiensis]|uniref:Uncharacterized protein n=1 Tax=Alligator mississippiensis TaxID=8496 RepID=A0A151MJ92_ALLMI|nr:hypothetical protein Y1Q_0023232 [Alligator mississippiensis]